MKDPGIIPLSGKSNVSIVAGQLEDLIRDRFWQPDERILSEAELCSRFNVGRSTVREALNMLKAKGLVYTIPGKGTFAGQDNGAGPGYIPDPESSADLMNIMELRLGFEPVCAAFAARRATKEHIAAIAECQRILMQSREPGLFAETDLAFHMEIAKAAGNPLIEDAMNTVKTFLLQQQVITSQTEWRRTRASTVHEHIVEAIRSRKVAEAEKIMRAHIDDTCQYVKSLIAKAPDKRTG